MLRDKVILITGSSTGIGRASAELCIAAGANVMLHGLAEAETKQAAAALGQPYLALDLSLAEAPTRLIEAVLNQYGRLDGLVNNAACVERASLETTTAAFFDKMMHINVRAPLLLLQAALPQFIAQGGAAVVNIGSVNAYCGQPNLLPYAVSKGGLMTLTRNLANAYAEAKIRVNQLNPGWVLSENEIALQISEGQAADWYRHVPAAKAPRGSLLEPLEVARHVVHWLSDASAPVSGAVIDLEQFPLVGGRLSPQPKS